MENRSIWEKEHPKINSGKLKDTDVLIIGGGITGITAAYYLNNSGLKVTLLEKGKIGNGITKNSTAKISYLQGTIYQKLKSYFDDSVSKRYFKSQVYAISLLKNIIVENNIDCDFEKVESYLFAFKKSGLSKLEKEKKLLEQFGVKCTDKKMPIDFPAEGSFSVPENYVFNPVKYIYGVAKILNNVEINEETTVLEVKKENDYVVNTTNGIIKAKKLIIACHYPFFIFPGIIPIKNYIKREYVNAGKYEGVKNFTAINVEKDIHSIRFYKDYVIYVSNNHRLTNKIDYEKNYELSRKNFKKYFKTEPEYSWMNQDLITNDELPFIGKLKDNLFISSGYNAWGMTNGVIGAKIVSDLVMGKSARYSSLFSPNRISLIGTINSLIDGFCYAKAYIEAPFFKKENTFVTKIDGKAYNVYVDKEGKKHIAQRKCPHMKCDLVFNNEELTWDCPCHGSRFDIDGKLMEGPSKYDINKPSNSD